MSTTPTLVEAVCRVRRLLDTIGDALAAGHAAPLLETDGDLALALAALSSVPVRGPVAPALASALGPELVRCRAALERCRRLGASLDEFVGQALGADGRAGAYTRAGQAAILPPAGALHTRG